MSLTLRSNFNTVTIAGRTVKLVEKFDNSTTVNRFVETIANCTDEAAINYILNTFIQINQSYSPSTPNKLWIYFIPYFILFFA